VTSVAAPTLVLVVEDEALLRYAIAQALRDAGFEVVERATAEEAVSYAGAGGRVDVVFTDIQLPGRFNGWDVAEQFRAVNADVTIIYTSGNSANRSRRVTGSLFFDKPYDAAAVVQACRQRGVDVTAQDGEEKMQHYFLHIRNGHVNVDDPEGADFADLASARAEAIESARQLISQCVLAGTPMGLQRVFEIVDDDGQTVASVPFSEAIAGD
jgi:two-component system, response regulator PdtaR